MSSSEHQAEDTTVAGQGAVPARHVPHRGSVLGRYVVVDVVGEGGMGRVLRAYDPKLRREVALKMLRLDSDASAREQMTSEARAMARLSHPNALPVYDIDVDGEGRPFIAMEYVEGTTLRHWLREEPRSLREVVDAFMAAGAGLAAAHTVGLVHRDFKPSNVLRGHEGRIRVMDFGLASATWSDDDSSTDDLVQTETPEPSTSRIVMGTPGYMAPEQHRGDPVDARCDHYAFAVPLCEALHGARPFTGANHDELLAAKERMLLSSGEPRLAVPRSLRRVLLRALSPEPAARFGSMDAMLVALRRNVGTRRRWGALFGVAILGSAGTIAWTSHRDDVRQARCRQLGEAIAEVWGPAHAETVEEAFRTAPPTYAADTFVRLRPWLDRYAEQWADMRAAVCIRPHADPQRTAAALTCLEERRAALQALVDLLQRPDAEVVTMAVPSAARLPAHGPCGDPSFLATMPALPESETARSSLPELRKSLAEVVALGHAGRFEEAGQRVDLAIERAQALDYRPLVAKSFLVAGRVANWRGQFATSRGHTEKAFVLAAEAGLDEITLEAAVDLTALVGVTLAEHDVGLTWDRFAQAILKRQGWQGRPIHARLLAARGRIFSNRAEFEAAIEVFGKARKIQEERLGAEHPGVADVLSDLGNVFERRKDYDEAIAHHLQALHLRRAALGDSHPSVAASLNNLGNAHWGRGDVDVAADYLREAAQIKAAVYGQDHLKVGSTLQNLGNVMYSQGRYEEAIGYWHETLEIRNRALPEVHPDRGTVLANLAAGYLVTGQLDAALDHAERAAEVTRRVHGAEHIEVAPRWRTLGAIHHARGDVEEALRCFREELAIVRKVHGDSHESVAEARRELAKALTSMGDRQAAIVELELALETLQRADATPRALARVQMHLAETLSEMGADGARQNTTRIRELAGAAHAVLCDGDDSPDNCQWLAHAGSEGASPR